MTLPELTAALLAAPGGGFAALPPAIPVATLVRRFRHRVAGLDAIADSLRAHADEVDRDDARDLHDSLVAVAEELRAAFSL
jgi:hypothetical protein